MPIFELRFFFASAKNFSLIASEFSLKETLENPSHPRENSRVSAGAD
jgi:hypothetical protein